MKPPGKLITPRRKFRKRFWIGNHQHQCFGCHKNKKEKQRTSDTMPKSEITQSWFDENHFPVEVGDVGYHNCGKTMSKILGSRFSPSQEV